MLNELEIYAINSVKETASFACNDILEGTPKQVFETCVAVVDRVIWLHENQRSGCHVAAKSGVVFITDPAEEALFKLARP